MKYLDTNIIVYAIENHPKYGQKCKEILLAVQNNQINVCASMTVLIELMNVLVKLNKVLEKNERLNIEENISAVLSLPIRWHDLSFPIIKCASRYDFKISGVDYIHIATMELNSTFEIISADSDFDRVTFLHRLDPLEFK